MVWGPNSIIVVYIITLWELGSPSGCCFSLLVILAPLQHYEAPKREPFEFPSTGIIHEALNPKKPSPIWGRKKLIPSVREYHCVCVVETKYKGILLSPPISARFWKSPSLKYHSVGFVATGKSCMRACFGRRGHTQSHLQLPPRGSQRSISECERTGFWV